MRGVSVYCVPGILLTVSDLFCECITLPAELHSFLTVTRRDRHICLLSLFYSDGEIEAQGDANTWDVITTLRLSALGPKLLTSSRWGSTWAPWGGPDDHLPLSLYRQGN